MAEVVQKPWMLYGANGFTGDLIATEAVKRGMRPTLAGRRRDAVAPLAQRLGLPFKIISLDDRHTLHGALRDMRAVLLAAGPFSRTAEPMREACLATHCHYLDITGEVPVLEATARQHGAALSAGCTFLPGVGLDVVPSDCLAAALHEALPNATRLELGIYSSGGISRGTAKSMLDGMARGRAAVREAGLLRPTLAGSRTRMLPFIDRALPGVLFPWGDLVTAYVSTGIPNIAVYFALSPRGRTALRLTAQLAPTLRLPGVLRLLQRAVDHAISSPNAERRASGRCFIWGEVTSPDGGRAEGWVQTPEGYVFTAHSAVTCVERLLLGQSVSPGMVTPSLAFGPRFVESIAGCTMQLRVHDRGRSSRAG